MRYGCYWRSPDLRRVRERAAHRQRAQDLEARADSTLQSMISRDPGLQAILNASYGYAVFPSIGKGGFIVGAAYGRGILYEHGRPVGSVEVNQGSLGAQLGGQTLSELVLLRDSYDVARLESGNFTVGGDVAAVALTAGAAASGRFTNGVEVFVMPLGGAMVDVSVNGQKINFRPFA